MLISADGRVMTAAHVGIVSHIISKSGGSEGLGFVVTLRTARDLLLEKKSIWGGVDGMLLAEIFNVPCGAGRLVKTVAKNSPMKTGSPLAISVLRAGKVIELTGTLP